MSKCIEDVVKNYLDTLNHHMFLKKNLTTIDIIINILHIIGVLYIFIGMFLPSFHLPQYAIYILIIISSFHIFKNNCFLTDFVSRNKKLSKIPYKDCDKSQLVRMRMSSIYNNLEFLLLLTFIGIYFPEYSLYNLLKLLVDSLIPFSEKISFLPIIILISLICMYVLYTNIVCKYLLHKNPQTNYKGCSYK